MLNIIVVRPYGTCSRSPQRKWSRATRSQLRRGSILLACAKSLEAALNRRSSPPTQTSNCKRGSPCSSIAPEGVITGGLAVRSTRINGREELNLPLEAFDGVRARSSPDSRAGASPLRVGLLKRASQLAFERLRLGVSYPEQAQ